MKSYTPGSILAVTWDDAAWQNTDSWIAPTREDCRLHRIVTVGHLLRQTKTTITLAASHDTVTDYVDGAMTIPVAGVRKVRVLG